MAAEGRVFNFSAGPAAMPLEVLETLQRELLNYNDVGVSILEMSHRSKEYVALNNEAEKNLRDILGVPGHCRVLFTQGGGTLQFAAVPMNMLGQKTSADYMVTGQWSERAAVECRKYSIVNMACDSTPLKFTTIPHRLQWNLDQEAAYVHYCSNETIEGVEWSSPPDVGSVPLVSDMSSNFMSRPIDFDKHAVIYAGVHKNAGPSGMAVNIVKDEYCSGKHELKFCPSYTSWKVTADHSSLHNTPPSFTFLAMAEYLKYTRRVGGIAHWTELSEKKSRMIYDAIDASDGFYTSNVDMACRSRMNIPFMVGDGDESLEKKFLAEAKKLKLYALAGHPSVGHIRASLYNGIPMEGVDLLSSFMKSFMDENRS